MPLDLANEVWSELKRYVNTVDRGEAAETLVNVLIDNGYDGTEIREAFKGDSEIKRVLSAYIEDQEEDEEEEEYDDYEEDEY